MRDECWDPDGRLVELPAVRWRHIALRHPELADHLSEVLSTVERPARRMPGRLPNEEWFYAEDAGPSHWS